MDLFAVIVGFVISMALIVIIRRAKRKQSQPIAGRFDFDTYKASELDRHGLIDRTKWR